MPPRWRAVGLVATTEVVDGETVWRGYATAAAKLV